MAVEIRVPAVGESISEGTISRWLKKDGDAVRSGETVFELETEKATTDVPAPAGGVLKVLVKEGTTVKIGAVVGRLEDGGAAPAGAPVPAAAARSAPPPTTPNAIAPTPRTTAEEKPTSPAVRQLAADNNLDLAQIPGTGKEGRITKDDVLAFMERQKAATPPVETKPPAVSVTPATAETKATAPTPTRGERRERMSSIRARIAQRLVSAQQSAAILTTFNEADMSAVMGLRTKYKETFQKKHGVGLGFMSFFVKAVVEALHAFPDVNAWIDGQDVVHHDYYDIGVAVSTERGLMVPVVRDADRMSFADIEKRIGELAVKARDGKISVADLQGGTFSITNGGVFGSLLSTPILNTPQSAILGMHSIQKRPVVVDDVIVVRPMMYLALSYDHRLIDGKQAVSFLVRVKECIENPERLLLEV